MLKVSLYNSYFKTRFENATAYAEGGVVDHNKLRLVPATPSRVHPRTSYFRRRLSTATFDTARMRRAITPSLEQSVLALLDTSRSNASRLRASEAIVAAPQALLSPWVAPWGSNLIAQSVEDMFSPDAVLGAAQARVLLCVLRLGATSTAQMAAFLRRMSVHIVPSSSANVSRSHDLFFLVLAHVTSPRASLFDEEAGRGGGGAGGGAGGGEGGGGA